MSMQPYFVEVFGTPEAGKTTAIKEVITSLTNNGNKVLYIQESAEVVPTQFPKNSIEAHIWMRLRTAQSVLLATFSQTDIVIADRRILDALFMNYLYFKQGKLSKTQLDAMQNFFTKLFPKPDLAIAFLTTPEEAISRRGGEGRIVTKEYIKKHNKAFISFCNIVEPHPILLDTTHLSADLVSQFTKVVIEKHFYNH